MRKQETSSGSESSDSGSWELIILETPNGTRRLYVVQTTVEDTQPEMQNTTELMRKN